MTSSLPEAWRRHQFDTSLWGNVAGCGFIIDLPEIGGAAKLEAMGVEVKRLWRLRGIKVRSNSLQSTDA